MHMVTHDVQFRSIKSVVGGTLLSPPQRRKERLSANPPVAENGRFLPLGLPLMRVPWPGSLFADCMSALQVCRDWKGTATPVDAPEQELPDALHLSD